METLFRRQAVRACNEAPYAAMLQPSLREQSNSPCGRIITNHVSK